MRYFILFLLLIITMNLAFGQKYNGYVITDNGKKHIGNLQIRKSNLGGYKIEVHHDFDQPLTFNSFDLKEYAFKKDTFAILFNVYPFDDEDYTVDRMEAKIIVRGGKLQLLMGELPKYLKHFGAPGPYGPYSNDLNTYYLVKEKSGNVRGIKKDHNSFIEIMETLISDDNDLFEKVRNKFYTYRNLPEIVSLYNQRHPNR